MYPRCSGWTSRTALQPVDDLRRGARHGHRQMHNVVSARVPCVCLSEMEYRLPGLDQSGPRQSLYSYVRHIDNG
jgi:hypothetical protein